jgi:hypothetical protein
VFEQLEIPTKDKDGKDSINESIINLNMSLFRCGYISKCKSSTTFGQSIYDKIDDGRIYTNFNPHGCYR